MNFIYWSSIKMLRIWSFWKTKNLAEEKNMFLHQKSDVSPFISAIYGFQNWEIVIPRSWTRSLGPPRHWCGAVTLNKIRKLNHLSTDFRWVSENIIGNSKKNTENVQNHVLTILWYSTNKLENTLSLAFRNNWNPINATFL